MWNKIRNLIQKHAGFPAAFLTAAVLFLAAGVFASAAFAAGPVHAGEEAPQEGSVRPGAASAFSDSVSMEAEYGYENCAKAGRYLPMTLRLENSAAEDLEGTVAIRTRQSDGSRYAYHYPVLLSSGSKRELSMSVPLGSRTEQLLICLTDKDGAVVQEQRLRLNINTVTPELFVGILSDRPEDLKFFNGVSVNYGQMRTRAFNLSADTFPEDRTRLDPLDVIVVSGFRMSRLSVEQTRALMQWMREGGVLLFGTGLRVDDTIGSYAPEFLDDMYEDPVQMELDLEELQSMDVPGGSSVILNMVELSLHGGSTVLSAEGEPLVYAANKGNGVLAAVTFDLAEISDYAQNQSYFTDLLLARVLGRTRLDRLTSEAYGTGYDEYWSAETLINNGLPGRKPDLGMFGILLAVYILLLGPGLYVFLKSRSLSVWYFRSAAILSAAASILFYALGARTRFRDTFYTYALVRDVTENAVSDTAYLSLRNPGSEAYSVQVAEGFQVFPLTGAEGQEERGRRGTEDRIGVTIEELSSGSRITVRSAGAFSPRMFRMNRSAAREDDQGFSGSISLFEDEYSGKVKNRNPFPVEQAFVLTFGKIIPLGTIDPGETVDLIGQPLYRIPLNDSYTVAAFLAGVYDGAAGQEAHLEALEKANFLSFYLKDQLSDYSADARVIGFAGEHSWDMLLKNEGLQNYGNMLITANIPVDNRKDGLVCRSVLSRTPEVLSGDYIVETNSFYPGEPVVLGYLADPDITIRQMIFEDPDPVFENGNSQTVVRGFSGTISFYNYGTGNFDDMPEGQRVFESTELRHYLSPDNMITVRYAETTANAGGQLDAALPIVTVIGEEN